MIRIQVIALKLLQALISLLRRDDLVAPESEEHCCAQFLVSDKRVSDILIITNEHTLIISEDYHVERMLQNVARQIAQEWLDKNDARLNIGTVAVMLAPSAERYWTDEEIVVQHEKRSTVINTDGRSFITLGSTFFIEIEVEEEPTV